MESMESGNPSSIQGPPMDPPDNDTYKQLLEQIKIMNENLEAASFAINNLTMQLSSLGPIAMNSILPQMANGNQENTAPDGPYTDTSDHGEQATHVMGYVNWDDSHNKLKNLHLVKMKYIRDALAKLKAIKPGGPSASDNKNNKQLARYTDYEDEEEHEYEYAKQKKTGNGLFIFTHSIPVVGKEDRFPQDSVYIDVNAPKIKAEMDFMNNILVPPTDGVFDRFSKIIESEMMTCAIFEKKFGLKWV